jgi:radical SAM protein with 4Fe4S-binding SPASM domain
MFTEATMGQIVQISIIHAEEGRGKNPRYRSDEDMSSNGKCKSCTTLTVCKQLNYISDAPKYL